MVGHIIQSRTEVVSYRGYPSETRTLSYYSRTDVGVYRSKLGVTREYCVELVPTRSISKKCRKASRTHVAGTLADVVAARNNS